jgi:hypothetical protein
MKNRSMKRTFAPLLCAALLLCTACKPQTPEEQLKAYNAKLGAHGELTATHLIVRWPARGAGDRPVAFKVPREYLVQERPVIKNEAGDIEAIYLTLAMPEATAWQPMTPRVSNSDSPERRAEWERHTRTRKFVVLSRELRGGLAWRDSVRRRGQGGTPGYGRDGTVAGLERYSPTACRNGPHHFANQQFLDAKPADDPSPLNCRLDRRAALLASPPEVTADNEGVAVWCSSTSCTVFFVSGRRGTEISLDHDDLPRWREYVEPIRKRIDSFVID